MHYYRRDGVWNGAGHQSRAPFDKMMHWGEMQTDIRLQRVSRNDPRISTIFYHYVSRQDAVQHTQIWLKWEMNWTKERWHFCWNGFFWVGSQSWPSLLGQVFWDRIMMFALIKVSARTAFAENLTWGWVVYLCTEHWSYWLRELIPAGELVYWVFCVPDGMSYFCWGWHQCLVKHMFRTAVSPGWARQYKHPQMY